jgi:hypothetical protein
METFFLTFKVTYNLYSHTLSSLYIFHIPIHFRAIIRNIYMQTSE